MYVLVIYMTLIYSSLIVIVFVFIQDYLGAYVADSTGRLVFSPGPLVRAVKEGWWLLLDELNLAPSEVIFAHVDEHLVHIF